MGVGFEPRHGLCFDHVRLEPLGTVYRDDSLDYGMAILDISNLDEIRYGIVGFLIRDPHPSPLAGEWHPSVQTVEENRPRIPLSSVQYMSKFGYQVYEAVLNLEEMPLVDSSAMDSKAQTYALFFLFL